MKSRLAKAMEAHGVTIGELRTVLKSIYDPKLYDDDMIVGIIGNLVSNDSGIRCLEGEVLIALAKLCNVSTDYLLGMTDNMTPLG